MKDTIICKNEAHGTHSFYIRTRNNEYFLFSQDFRKSVHNYFNNEMFLNKALDFKGTHNDAAIRKTISKLPSHIKYIEKEYGIEILTQTKKKYSGAKAYKSYVCA